VIVLQILALVAFICVPGWLAVSLLPSGDTLKGYERLYLAAILGMGIVSLCSLALALASSYSLAAMVILVGAICLLLLWLAKGRIAWPLRLKPKELLLSLAIIAVALVLSVPPGRTVFGWSDVGLYPDIAANIEREGSITMESEAAREVAPERRDLLYEPATDTSQKFLAYENKAFLITDFETGSITPIFYYLWPAALAVFASFLGLSWQFWAITAMAVLGFWGLLMLAFRLLDRRWGLVAIVLAGLSPLFVYFSRYGTSEMMNMAIFVAASFCLTVYMGMDESGEDRSAVRMAFAASFLLGLGFLCRIDFLLVLLPLLLFYLGKRIFGRMTGADWWFCALTVIAAALATVLGGIFSQPYFYSIFRYLADDLGLMILVIVAGLAAVVLAFVFAPRLSKTARRVAKARKAWTILLWLCLAGFFIYLYFIRPNGADGVVNYGVINPIRGPTYISQTLVRWAWYLSFPGLLAIFTGYGLWFSRRKAASMLPVAMMSAALTLVFCINMRATPLHILTMRRLVPVVFPVAVLMAAYCLNTLVDAGVWISGKRRWGEIAGKAAAGALLLYLVLFAVNASLPIFGLEEGGNQLELTGEIAERVGEDGVVLIDYYLGDHLGPPLRTFYGVENAWLMDNATLDSDDFTDLISDLGFPEKEIYLLWRPGISGFNIPVVDGLFLEEAGDFVSWEETLEKSFVERPDSRHYDNEEILLYRVVEGDADDRLPAPQ
jgi:hypothetical protein